MTDTAVDGHWRGKTSKGRVLLLVLSTTFVLAALRFLPFPAITVQWPDAYHEDSTQYTHHSQGRWNTGNIKKGGRAVWRV